MKTTTADFHYVTEALQVATDCIWSLLDDEGANNVDDVLALIATGQTIADEARTRLTAADALAATVDEITTDFLAEINHVYESATGRSIEQDYSEDVEKWKAALREYREAIDG